MSTDPTTVEPEAAAWRCDRCGDPRWIGWRNGPAHEGWPRWAQCVPCGHVQALPEEVSDLVSGVLTRISELEQLARDAQVARGNGDWNVVAGPRQWGVLEVDTEVVSGGKMIARLSAEFGGYFHALHAVEHDPDAVLRLCRAHRQIVELFPVSEPHLDTEGSFYGFQSRDCGEHRTVGPHRAWCYDCSEWCYPAAPCARCHGVHEALRILAVGLGVVEEDQSE